MNILQPVIVTALMTGATPPQAVTANNVSNFRIMESSTSAGYTANARHAGSRQQTRRLGILNPLENAAVKSLK